MDRTLGNGLRLLILRHGVTPLAEARLHLPSPCPTPNALAESMLLAARLSGPRDGAGDDVELSVTADVHQTTVTACAALPETDSLMSALTRVAHGGHDGAPGELGPARGELIARLRMVRAHPDVMVRARLARHLFGDHPVTFPVPSEEELDGAEPRRGPYDPRGAVLVILAPGEPGPLADLAEQALSGWRPSDRNVPPLPPLPPIAGSRVAPLPHPGAPQSRVRLRAPAVTAEHEDYPALFLACNVLGGYVSSRLSRSLREDKGYVYGVSVFLDAHPGRGTLAVEADTSAGTTGRAVAALAAELRRMRTRPPGDEEIRAARAYALGSMATRLAPRAAYASALADLAAKGADPLLLPDFPRRLAAVPPDAVVAAAAEFFAPERFSGLVAADPPVIPQIVADGNPDLVVHFS